MKRSERQHLKENPVADLVFSLREATIGHSKEASAAVVIVVVAAAAAGGYFFWQSRRTVSADAALASAVTVAETPVVPPAPAGTPNQPAAAAAGTFPSERARLEAALPRFLDVASTYPSTDAATAAVYQAAGALGALGRLPEAEQRYLEVIARDGRGVYGEMAQLGLADVYRSMGQWDKAIEIYQKLSTAADTRLPADGVLLQLARTYAKAGKTEEATRTYTRIVEEFPQSLYVADARDALSALGKS
jgi:tetratricopeptide (TPR) repeat protein